MFRKLKKNGGNSIRKLVDHIRNSKKCIAKFTKISKIGEHKKEAKLGAQNVRNRNKNKPFRDQCVF